MADTHEDAQVNGVLVLAGAVLVAAGLLNWFLPEETPPTVVREQTSASRHVERSRPSSTRERTSDLPRRARAETVGRVGTKTVVDDPSDTTTTTDTAGHSRRSETMSVALLGFGFLSLLAGSAWPRLQSVTGPGGVGVTFASTLSGVSDIAAQQEERLKSVEGNVEKLSTTVELLVRQLIQASREG